MEAIADLVPWLELDAQWCHTGQGIAHLAQQRAAGLPFNGTKYASPEMNVVLLKWCELLEEVVNQAVTATKPALFY